MELKRLRTPEGAAWNMITELYEEAFPRVERRGREAFARALTEEAFFCMLLCDDSGEPFGFLTWWDMGDTLYIEHFATLPQMRGRGYGTRVLELVKASGKLLILEAELPTDEITMRRIGFYKRAGFVENAHRHLQPPYHADSTPLEMRLMSYPRAISVAEYAYVYAYIRQVVTGVPYEAGNI